jgi:hypothetical protein
MTIENVDQRRGHDLELRVRDALRLHGYDAEANVHLTGASGARHEFDVVGEKSDGLTRYRLVVECKAWARPIDKDVVYKLRGELSEVGAAHGLIVAPMGWTADAAAVASHLHIDLWGDRELSALLPALGQGPDPLGRTPVMARGLPFAIPDVAGRREVDRVAQGRLGHRGEAVIWFGAAWLPVWSLQLGLSRRQGLVRRVDAVTTVWNDYEALDATLLQGSTTDPTLVPVDVAEGAIRPRWDQKRMSTTIADAERRWLRARDVGVRESDAKFKRQLDARDAAKKTLADLGVEAPVEHISIDRTSLTYHPLWLGLLARGDRERFIAVDGVSGRLRNTLSDALTAQSRWVRESLTGL